MLNWYILQKNFDWVIFCQYVGKYWFQFWEKGRVWAISEWLWDGHLNWQAVVCPKLIGMVYGKSNKTKAIAYHWRNCAEIAPGVDEFSHRVRPMKMQEMKYWRNITWSYPSTILWGYTSMCVRVSFMTRSKEIFALRILSSGTSSSFDNFSFAQVYKYTYCTSI